jgi:hypothetical protein
VRLYGHDGSQMGVAKVANPHGASPHGEGAAHVADEKPGCGASSAAPACAQVGSKWLDASMGVRGEAVLELYLPYAAGMGVPAAYELVTGGDAPARDPVSWAIFCLAEEVDGRLSFASDVTEHVHPPHGRLTSYGRMGLTPRVPADGAPVLSADGTRGGAALSLLVVVGLLASLVWPALRTWRRCGAPLDDEARQQLRPVAPLADSDERRGVRSEEML